MLIMSDGETVVGETLKDPEENLLRQVHPEHFVMGKVGSVAFKPGGKDQGCLSVSRGALTTPEAAYNKHTKEKGLASIGVWAVTVGECQSLELDAKADPVREGVPDPAHAVIDMYELKGNPLKRKARDLVRFANARGCRYSPAPLPG